MLDYIIAGIIGIILYQIIIFVIYLSLKQDDEFLTNSGIAFVLLFILPIAFAYRKVHDIRLTMRKFKK